MIKLKILIFKFMWCVILFKRVWRNTKDALVYICFVRLGISPILLETPS